MKKKLKLELIENYIAIYRILYICKQRLFLANTKADDLEIICKKTTELKKDYELAFDKIGMVDNSLILLKSQLNTALNTPYNNHDYTPYTKLINKINEIKKVKDRILEHFKI